MKQVGIEPDRGPSQRPADQRCSSESASEHLRRWAPRHRRRHHGNRRNPAGRPINEAIVADINESAASPSASAARTATWSPPARSPEMREPKTGELLKVDLKQVGQPAKTTSSCWSSSRPTSFPWSHNRLSCRRRLPQRRCRRVGRRDHPRRDQRLLPDRRSRRLDEDRKLINDMTIGAARGLITNGTISAASSPRSRIASTR